ncbi:hypothetical protein AB5I41_22130 [Sphingomonas sp. MMS24-JH45]
MTATADPAVAAVTFLDLMAPPVVGTIDVAPRPEIAVPGKSLPLAPPTGDDPLAWLASVDAPAAALAAAPAALPTGTATPLVDDATSEEAIVADVPPADVRDAKGRKGPVRPDLPLPRFARDAARALKPTDAKVETTVTADATDEDPATGHVPAAERIDLRSRRRPPHPRPSRRPRSHSPRRRRSTRPRRPTPVPWPLPRLRQPGRPRRSRRPRPLASPPPLRMRHLPRPCRSPVPKR